MMIQDNTAWLDTEGKLFFVENFPEPVFVFNTSEVGVVEDVPHERLIQSKPSNDSKIFKLPRVGGLHNRYQWKRSSLNKPY